MPHKYTAHGATRPNGPDDVTEALTDLGAVEADTPAPRTLTRDEILARHLASKRADASRKGAAGTPVIGDPRIGRLMSEDGADNREAVREYLRNPLRDVAAANRTRGRRAPRPAVEVPELPEQATLFDGPTDAA